MEITSVITITELSKITKKSRPTIYKYIEDYNKDNYEDIPETILLLFNNINNNRFSKKDIYDYCDKWFIIDDNKENDRDLLRLINLLKENKNDIDLKKIINYVEKEIK